MRGPSLVALGGVLALLLVPAGAAQDPGSMYLAATEATGPGGDLPQCSANAYTMDSALPTDGKAYQGSSSPALACSTYFVHTVVESFTLSGDATAHFFVSCDSPVVVGTPVTVAWRVQLRKNGETLEQVDGSGGWGPCQGPSTVTEMTIDGIDTKDSSFAPGDTMTLVILTWTSGAAEDEAPSLHYLVGPTRPSAVLAVGLPGSAPLSGPGNLTLTTETLEGDEPSIEATFENATTTKAQYSWQTNLTAVQFDVEALITNGTAHLLVLDGSNAPIVNQTLENGTHVIDVPTAVPGNWSFLLEYSNFTGSVQLVAHEPVPLSTSTSTSTTASRSSTTTTSAERTGSFPLQYEKDTPMPGTVPLALALVAVAFLVLRRRLA